jgi:SH3 domain-containing YSC84-like protein 1
MTRIGWRLLSASLVVLFFVSPLFSQSKIQERLMTSKEVYQQLVNTPDREIPLRLISDAQCIAVIPHVVKAAFGIGGRHGRGVVSCRDSQGNWSPPAFISLSGGSFGLQIGGQASDLVLFIMSEKGARSLLKSKFTLGADVSVAAGPVGRSAEGSTDLHLNAEIIAYARARGLFAGLALGGASVRPDRDANESYYGAPLSLKAILFDRQVPRTPREAVDFVNALP